MLLQLGCRHYRSHLYFGWLIKQSQWPWAQSVVQVPIVQLMYSQWSQAQSVALGTSQWPQAESMALGIVSGFGAQSVALGHSQWPQAQSMALGTVSGPGPYCTADGVQHICICYGNLTWQHSGKKPSLLPIWPPATQHIIQDLVSGTLSMRQSTLLNSSTRGANEENLQTSQGHLSLVLKRPDCISLPGKCPRKKKKRGTTSALGDFPYCKY